MKEKTEMAINEDKKIDSIEQTVEKAKIRQDILSLAQQWLVYNELHGRSLNTFRCLTLPGKDWYFEYGLLNGIKNSFFLKNKPQFHFDGVEWKKDSSAKAFINMPDNATLTGKCSFDDFLKHNICFKKNGFGMVDYETIRQEELIYDLIWPDYCGEVDVEMLKKFALMIRDNIENGFAAITVKLNSRHKKQPQYVAQFKKHSHSKNLQKAIEDTINSMLRKYVNKDVRCVYNVIYAGGKIGGSTMLTMVYSVNIPKKAIISVKENRREMKSKTYSCRYQMAQKLMKARRWKVGRIGRPKVEKTREEIRIDAAVARWEGKWKGIKATKKIKIAAKYGISVHSFGSRVAHYHGKLGAKRAGKLLTAELNKEENELKAA